MIDFSLHNNIAILIDGDNVKNHWEQIFKISEYYGRRSICRAYGLEPSLSAKRIRDYADTFNIELIPVKKTKKGNDADNRLMSEAGEILGDQDNYVDVFFIVAGDGDYVQVCELIRERGRQVMVIANEGSTSDDLQGSYDELYYIADLKEKLSELKEYHPIPFDELREFFDPLIFAYVTLTNNLYWDWVSFDQLDKQLREIRPDYESKFGNHKLSEWLKSLTTDFEINEQEQKVRRIDPNPEFTRWQLIMDACIKIQDSDGFAPLGKLDKKLYENPHYKMWFGTKKLSRWLEDYPDVFRIEGNHVIHRRYWEG